MANMMLGKTDVRPQGNRPRDGRHCDLCGCSQPAVRCDKCGCQIFCLSCDDMYHRHPKRRFHLRKAVDPGPPTPQARPVLPQKAAHASPGDPSKMPLPPPRKKKPAGKSFFDTFRRRSPSADNSPPLPKKEYSWTDRLGNIKKFMSNRPLPPLPDTNGHDSSEFQSSPQPTKHDMSFIHQRVEEKPPQLPQRSLKPDNFTRDKENLSERPLVNNSANMRNGTLDPSMINRRFSGGEENWENKMPPQANTLNRQQPPQGYFPPGGPGFPGNMHQSSSATDLQNLEGYPGMPPHYPHYPMPPFPYPMYPPQAFPQQYFGSSFANLSSQPVTTTDGDFSDQSDASAHRPGKRYAFRKRAKRSQSVMMDRMAYPGQFFPFGPYPPGYPPGPWGAAPFPMEAPPSPASSVRSLNRLGRSRRRKKTAATSEDDDEDEPSLSSSPLSRPKSSSSERPPPPAQRRPPPPSSSSAEEESEEEERRRSEKHTRRGSDPPKQQLRRNSDPKRLPSPVPKSPLLKHKKTPKQKAKEIAKQSDSEEIPSPAKLERQPSRESNADQSEPDRPSAPFTPTGQWQCLHCTFINAGGSRICQVCCKTATADTAVLVGGSRPPSSADQSSSCPPSPEKRVENQDMAVLNSALDEAEEEINRGLQELMKLKEDFLPSKPPSKEPSPTKPSEPPSEPSPKPKPVYKSSGKMRTSILDKLNLKSTSTETQTAGPSKTDRVIEARRPSTSSTTSETYNSPTAQSPLLEPATTKSKSSNKRESSCQTQTDDLMGFADRKLVDDDSFFRRGSNGYDRRDGMQSPRRDGMQSPMYDRGFGGGFGMMQRSHSRASLFTGRMNDLAGPLEYGLGAAPMYRSVSRSSLTGDYTDNRFSEFHNLRKPDYYLSMEELVERRRQESIRAQGLELVRMIREAEQQGFSADDIQVALSNCGPQNPLEWLQENWRGMVEGVVGLSASYARDKRDDDVGTVSEAEARDALRLHKGHVWAAVTECVESRQRKFLELKARGKFKNKDITDALSSSQGDVEAAYAKLTKSSSKPFLMRIWGAGEGVANQDPAPQTSDAYGRHQSQYYSKDIADDVLSDEAWEEEEVDWEEDSEDDEEQGDLEDLRTCHEDLSEIKTPESDSEYDDAFGSNTLERNVRPPSSDVIPEVKQEKKGGGFLSKLAALRKEDKGKKATFYGSDVDVSSLEDDVIKEEETKAVGPLSVIKNTLSAIRDSVKGEKKASGATVDKRTIIVRGQIEQEEKGGVTLVSAKPLKEEDWGMSRQEGEELKMLVDEDAGGKKVANEPKRVGEVDGKQKEAEKSFNSEPSTSGYVPPNKQQDKSSPVPNTKAVEKTVQNKTEDEASSHKKDILSIAKRDSGNLVSEKRDNETPGLSNSTQQKNSLPSPKATTSVKTNETSTETLETVRTSSIKQSDKTDSVPNSDEARKVKFQIADEKKETAVDKPSSYKISDTKDSVASTSNATKDSEKEKHANSTKITKKDNHEAASNSKTLMESEQVSNHEENLSGPETLNSKSDVQSAKNLAKEKNGDTVAGKVENKLKSSEQITSDDKKLTVTDINLQNNIRENDVKGIEKINDTKMENEHQTTIEKADNLLQKDEGFTKFPPVNSVIKSADSAQAVKENAETVQMDDIEIINSDKFNASSKTKERNSPQENKTSDTIPYESAVQITNNSEPNESDPKSSNISNSVCEEVIKDIPKNSAKVELKSSSATKKVEQLSNKASGSGSTVPDEKLKTVSEKKPSSVKPKFKLVKLNKNEPEKNTEPSNKKTFTSKSSSPKIDLNGDKNVKSSSENVSDIPSHNSPISTTEKEIYPPDVVEKIKLIPISSDLSPQKTESLSPIPNIPTVSSSEMSPLPNGSKQNSILESQQSDSSSTEFKEGQTSEPLKDNKTDPNSKKPSISDTESPLETVKSSTELMTPELNAVETTSNHQIEPPSGLSPNQLQLASTSSELNQQVLASAPRDPSPSKTPTVSPDPVQHSATTPSPEPVPQSSVAASPDPVQQLPTTESSEPESPPMASPEQPTRSLSPKPVQQPTTSNSPERVQPEPTSVSPELVQHPSASTEPVQQPKTSTNTSEPLQQPTSTSPEETSEAERHSKEKEPNVNETSDSPLKSSAESKVANSLEDTTPSSATENATSEDEEEGSSDYSRSNSMSPPNPIDTLRNRFEGLMDPSNNSTGTVRPQSPFRRMSFRSTKAIIALERTRDTSVEKPWFLPKAVPEIKKAAPKRSIKQQLEMERRVRKMVSDRKCRTYRKAEIVVQLMDMNFEEEEALQAANDCSTLEQAISYLQQECLLCTGSFPVSHIISMVHCPHKACRECLRAYFTVQIRDRNIMELLCPFCNEPDIFDEDVAQDYFNHLDIMLKKLIDPEIHELFQRKLRDRVLMRDPNFKWCSQCSSGFIAMPNLKRLVCPDCNAVTCASCRRPWEREHQGISCEAFAAWKDAVDPEAQTLSLAKLLTEEGIDCPRCHFRYQLAKGGCMHFRCTQCQHDFCSGCYKPFKMGQKCGVSEFCAKLGLHAHHPRNCLFYLRDKEPEDLQRLLDMSGVKYDKEPNEEQDGKNTCQVMEQKETADGMLDDYCGKDVEKGFAGLCRLHYVEYLGQLVNKHRVDPIQIFEKDDLELVLRRANIRLPPKRYRESDDQYKEKLIKLIQEELPLDKVEGS